MPARDEITEEGFGYFRGTWYIGRATFAEARNVIADEEAILDWLDRAALDPGQFESLASAIEKADAGALQGAAKGVPMSTRITDALSTAEELGVLGDLEIGVAGLTYALSALGCLTAASCRWHPGTQSWSDCPVVFFAAPAWRVAVLAELIAASGNGLEEGRGMLSVYGRSIHDTHHLAASLIAERQRFRKMPRGCRASPATAERLAIQMNRIPGLE